MTTQKPRISFVISEESKKKLEKLAMKQKRSISNYVLYLVEKAIEQAEQEEEI